MNSTARRFFDKHVKGKNIMTPNRLDVRWTRDGEAYELTHGTDFDNQPMWGVTVLDDDKIDSDRSKLFNEGTTEERRDAASRYCNELRGGDDA